MFKFDFGYRIHFYAPTPVKQIHFVYYIIKKNELIFEFDRKLPEVPVNVTSHFAL